MTLDTANNYLGTSEPWNSQTPPTKEILLLDAIRRIEASFTIGDPLQTTAEVPSGSEPDLYIVAVCELAAFNASGGTLDSGENLLDDLPNIVQSAISALNGGSQ